MKRRRRSSMSKTAEARGRDARRSKPADTARGGRRAKPRPSAADRRLVPPSRRSPRACRESRVRAKRRRRRRRGSPPAKPRARGARSRSRSVLAVLDRVGRYRLRVGRRPLNSYQRQRSNTRSNSGSCGPSRFSFGSTRLCTLTPSSRTGRWPASVRRAARARAPRCRPRRGSAGARVAARDGREVRVADLDRHRPADERLALEPRRAVARHLVDLPSDLVEIGEVLGERVLGARRLRRLVRFDRTIVDAVGQLAQPVGVASDRLAQHRRIGRAHVDEPFDAALAQPLRGDRPDAPQRIDRQLAAGTARRAPARSRSGRRASSSPRRSSPGTCSARRRPTPSVRWRAGSRP